MLTQENALVSGIDSQFLSTLDLDQLGELLEHKNKLLSIALISGIKFRDYILSIKNEMEIIRAEINVRKSKTA